jgi:hypothetical protein
VKLIDSITASSEDEKSCQGQEGDEDQESLGYCVGFPYSMASDQVVDDKNAEEEECSNLEG